MLSLRVRATSALAVAATLTLAPAAAAAGAARRPAASPPAGQGSNEAAWAWPTAGHDVVRGFVAPPTPWGAGHRGVDLAAPPAAPVRAAGAGRVTFAGRLAGRGVVAVSHGHGLVSTYEPVEPLVSVGDQVAVGDVLGSVARDAGSVGHCAPTPCLHWGLRQGGSYLDPLGLVGLGPVRLLPWSGPTDTTATGQSTVEAVAVGSVGGDAPAPSSREGRPARRSPAALPGALLTGAGVVTLALTAGVRRRRP